MQWLKNFALIVFNACVPCLQFLTLFYLHTTVLFDALAPVIAAISVYATNDDHSWSKARPRYQTYIILIWATRYFCYLVLRNLRMPREKQFESGPFYIDTSCPLFLIPVALWLAQGILILPTLFMISSEDQPHVTWQDWIGWLLALIALLVVSWTDFLKSQLEMNPPKKFDKPSEWYYSYKPKVFGEVIFWLGLYISASAAYASWWMHAAAIGVIFCDADFARRSHSTLTEVWGEAKWDSEPRFQIYTGRYENWKREQQQPQKEAENTEEQPKSIKARTQ